MNSFALWELHQRVTQEQVRSHNGIILKEILINLPVKKKKNTDKESGAGMEERLLRAQPVVSGESHPSFPPAVKQANV